MIAARIVLAAAIALVGMMLAGYGLLTIGDVLTDPVGSQYTKDGFLLVNPPTLVQGALFSAGGLILMIVPAILLSRGRPSKTAP